MSDWTLVAFKQREEERRRKEEVELVEAKIEHEQGRGSGVSLPGDAEAAHHHVVPWAEAARVAKEKRRQREEAETIKRAERERLLRDLEETRPGPKGGIAQVEGTHKKGRGFFSVLITACIAGAIGFGVGVYLVPTEETAQFRAQVERGLDSIYEETAQFRAQLKGGLDSIYEAIHPNKDNTKVQPAKPR